MKNRNILTTVLAIALVLVLTQMIRPSGSAAQTTNDTVTLTVVAPKTVHSNESDRHDHYAIGNAELIGTFTNTRLANATTFDVNLSSWGNTEEPLTQFFGATRRVGVRLDSSDFQEHSIELVSGKAEMNWDIWSSISSSGSNDGDTVRWFIVNDGRKQVIAEAEIWTGMVKVRVNTPGINIYTINPTHHELNLIVPDLVMGRYVIPMTVPAGDNIVRTSPIFIGWDMSAMNLPLPIFKCAKIGVEIHRLTGPGHVGVVIDANVVKRPGPSINGDGILFGQKDVTFNVGSAMCSNSYSGQALCFRSAQHWLDYGSFDNNVVQVAGWPFTLTGNTQISIALNSNNLPAPTAEQIFNTQYVAFQLSIASNGSPITTQGYFRSQLGLYNQTLIGSVPLTPNVSVFLNGGITLSSNVRIDNDSTLGELVMQSQSAILRSWQRQPNADSDLLKIAAIFKLLNERYCQPGQ